MNISETLLPQADFKTDLATPIRVADDLDGGWITATSVKWSVYTYASKPPILDTTMFGVTDDGEPTNTSRAGYQAGDPDRFHPEFPQPPVEFLALVDALVAADGERRAAA